jgi:hypothetical protein
VLSGGTHQLSRPGGQLRRDGERRADRLLCRLRDLAGGRRRQGLDLGGVQRGEDAADDRDAQRPADLARRVVDRRAMPAWSVCTAPMIDSVAGALVRPMPSPRNTICPAISA